MIMSLFSGLLVLLVEVHILVFPVVTFLENFFNLVVAHRVDCRGIVTRVVQRNLFGTTLYSSTVSWILRDSESGLQLCDPVLIGGAETVDFLVQMGLQSLIEGLLIWDRHLGRVLTLFEDKDLIRNVGGELDEEFDGLVDIVQLFRDILHVFEGLSFLSEADRQRVSLFVGLHSWCHSSSLLVR